MAQLQCGIVGLPNVGKSTLFNALSNAGAEAANYPFCTIEPNVGIVPVPDERLDALSGLVNPQKVLPAVVQIVDIAGLVKGAHKGEGLGNQFLANIREVDAILHVLRCFEDENITHVETTVDPIRDKEIIDIELQLKDIETLEKREKAALQKTKGGDKSAVAYHQFIQKLRAFVEEGQSARAYSRNEQEAEWMKELFLLTDKPILYVCNVDEAGLTDEPEHVARVREMATTEGAEVVVISASAEAQIAAIEEPEERTEFLEMMGLEQPGLNRLIRKAYSLLGLQTYFTAGPKEVRAWTIPIGFKAPQAASVIHSDFEKHFIRAEVIKFTDYVALKTEQAVKEAGKLGVEGKEYVVQDGDVMHFRTSA